MLLRGTDPSPVRLYGSEVEVHRKPMAVVEGRLPFWRRSSSFGSKVVFDAREGRLR